MKKPKTLEEILKIVFLWLGIAFLCLAFLSYIGLLRPTSHSRIQDPMLMGYCFGAVSIAFLSAGIIFGSISAIKDRQQSELLANGFRITGTVESIYLQMSIRFNSQSPYRIRYTYTYKGRQYHHQSRFLWTRPNLEAGDAVVVYVDDRGNSAVLL